MLLVITYDVNISSEAGTKRLRKVAKLCEQYGIRVQNSVFEVLIDSAQLTKLKSELARVIDNKKDSVRFYCLGNSYRQKIDVMGCDTIVRSGEPMLL